MPDDAPRQFRREKAFDARHCYLLKDVVVSPEKGLTWTPEGTVLLESVGSLFRMTGWDDARHELLRPVRSVSLASPSAVVHAFPPTGYFHWLLEIVPAALRARTRFPQSRALLPTRVPAYVEDGLDLLVGPGSSRDAVRADGPARVPRLLLVALGEHSGFVPSDDVNLLRRAGASVMAPQGFGAHGLGVFVSRKHATKRPLAESAAVERKIAAAGLEIVVAERLALRHQIAMFRSARRIAGPHGAGLANMVFSEPGCDVVELFPTGVFNDCYARLAATCGHSYRSVQLGRGGMDEWVP